VGARDCFLFGFVPQRGVAGMTIWSFSRRGCFASSSQPGEMHDDHHYFVALNNNQLDLRANLEPRRDDVR